MSCEVLLMTILEVKSKFHADFRRFHLDLLKCGHVFEELYQLLENLHGLDGIPFVIEYGHPVDHGILPINNDDNYAWALKTCAEQATQGRAILRLFVSRRGESVGENFGYNLAGGATGGHQILNGTGIGTGPHHSSLRPWEKLRSLRNTSAMDSSILSSGSGSVRGNNAGDKSTTGSIRSANSSAHTGPRIQLKNDFRVVSSIIDVDRVPTAYRRVRLIREDLRPLGFFIRTGLSMRVSEEGIERVQGVFISKLVPGGLAEMTGLIAVDDEVIEVNGIEVQGKTLDQVTDMMVANSANLIITLKPVNENTTLRRPPRIRSIMNDSNRTAPPVSNSFTGSSSRNSQFPPPPPPLVPVRGKIPLSPSHPYDLLGDVSLMDGDTAALGGTPEKPAPRAVKRHTGGEL